MPTVFVFVEPPREESWSYPEFYRRVDAGDAAAARIAGHEALKYRFAEPQHLWYEHEALVREI